MNCWAAKPPFPPGATNSPSKSSGQAGWSSSRSPETWTSSPHLSSITQSARPCAPTPTALIIDLTRVDFLASIGMNLLVATRDEIAPTTRFGVVADGPATSRPMKIIGIDTMIALYQTLGDALDAFAGT